MFKGAVAAVGAVVASLTLFLVVISGGAGAQGGANTSAATVLLEDLAAQSCVGIVNGPPRSVLVAGDSITVRSEPALAAAERATPVSYDATVGWRLEAGAPSVEAAVKATRPGLLVMAFGTNDWGGGASPAGIASYQAAVTAFLAAIPASSRSCGCCRTRPT